MSGDPRPADERAALERRADERFVHALLAGHLGDDRRALEARVEQVARAIEDDRRGSARRRSAPWLGAVVSSGVLAAVGIVLVAVIVTPRSARADLQHVIEAVGRTDLTYAIEVALEPDPRRRLPRRPLERLAWLRPGAAAARLVRRSAESLDGGLLYVRGEQYVLVREHGPFRLAQGFDGQRTWRVLPRGGAQDLPENAPEPRLVSGVADLLFVDLEDVLARARDDYHLTDRGTLELEGDARVHHYTGTRRIAAPRGPRELELFVDEATGQPLEITLAGLHGPLRGPRYEVRLRLASTEELPADWFTAPAHGG